MAGARAWPAAGGRRARWLCGMRPTSSPMYAVVSATVHEAKRGSEVGHPLPPQHSLGDVAASVYVTPTFHEDAPSASRVALDLTASLTSTATWVSCGASLSLVHAGKGFEIKLACAKLPAGCHYAEVVGTDPARPASFGELFRIPITVIKPHADLRPASTPPVYTYEHVHFTPGHIERRFVVPPQGATWATVRIEAKRARRSREMAGPVTFMLHTTQLLPSTSIKYHEHVQRSPLPPPQTRQRRSARRRRAWRHAW